jgi:hypothetical protein
MKIIPKDWRTFQHYKDRDPPWIKLHKKLLDNYEFSRLPVASRALAPMLWLLASEYEGGEIEATLGKLAYRLHMTEGEVAEALQPLIEARFFVTDSSALADCEQGARLETEAEIQVETEKIAPTLRVADPRTKLFSESLRTLASITGKTPDSCRSLVGRWLKIVNDEAIHVIAAIEDAERNRIADPVAWINQSLKPRGSNGKTGNVIDAADRLIQRIADFDKAPDESGVRSGAGENLVRLLPPGRSERS